MKAKGMFTYYIFVKNTEKQLGDMGTNGTIIKFPQYQITEKTIVHINPYTPNIRPTLDPPVRILSRVNFGSRVCIRHFHITT
jgi:hypothetical protein